MGDGGCKGKEEKYEGNRNGRKRTTEQGRQRVGKERKKSKEGVYELKRRRREREGRGESGRKIKGMREERKRSKPRGEARDGKEVEVKPAEERT